MAEYDLKQINDKKKNDKRGRNALTSQEMAVWTREWGNDALNQSHDEDKKITLDDDTTASEEAQDESVGFFGFFKRLFSTGVDIDFNGTRLKGNEGFQVKGGSVPLFDGVVLDLTSAEMKGEKENKNRQKVVPKEGGTAAKLVVAPKNKGFMKEHEVDLFIIAAPRGGSVDVFLAEIDSPMSYDIGDGKELKSEGAIVGQNNVILKNAKLEKDGSEKELETAEINRDGVDVVERSEQTPESTESTVGNTAVETTTVEAKDGEKKDGEKKISISMIELVYNKKTGEFSFGAKKEWSSDDEEDDDQNKDEKLMDYIKHPKDMIKKKYDEYKSKVTEILEKFKFEKSAIDTYFKTGKMPENVYAKNDEGENKSKFKEIEAKIEILPSLYVGVQFAPEYNYGFNFNFAIEKPEGGENEDLKFTITGTNEEPTVDFADENEFNKEFNKNIVVSAMLQGSLGAALKLFLRAGLYYIYETELNVYAKGEVSGNGEDNTFVKAGVSVPISLQKDSSVSVAAPTVDLSGGIKITGEVGAEANMISQLFDWKKNVISYTFGKWNLANIGMAVKLKKKDDGSKFYEIGGWDVLSSDFELSAFGKKIKERKNSGGNTVYGISYEEKVLTSLDVAKGKTAVEQLNYISGQLKNILDMIKEGKAKCAISDEGSEGYKGLVNQINTLLAVLQTSMTTAKNNLEIINKDIDSFASNKKYKEAIDKANAGYMKHENRLKDMEEWASDLRHDVRVDSFIHYMNIGGGSGAVKDRKKQSVDIAKKKVATKERLIAYETSKRDELTQKHSDRIKELKILYDGMNSTQKNKKNVEFLEKYKSMEAKQLEKEAYKYATLADIKAFEKRKVDKFSASHKLRADILEEYCNYELHLSSEDRKKPNKKFIEYYTGPYIGASGYFKNHFMENHGDIEDVIQYERTQVKENDKNADARLSRIEVLKRYKDMYDKAPDKDGKDEQGNDIKGKESILNEARKQHSKNGGRVTNAAGYAATKQNILQYEKDRYRFYRNKDLQNAEKDKKKLFSQWISKKDDKDIKNLITLDMIKEYEEGRKKLYEDKGKSDEDESLKKHKDRLNEIEKAINNKNINGILDSSGKNERLEKNSADAINNAKTGYFNNAKGYLDEFKKGEHLNDGLIEMAKSDLMGEHTKIHKKRIEKLCKYMGIEVPKDIDSEGQVDTSASNVNDVNVHEYYYYVLKGERFNKEYGKNWKKLEFSIDEMLNFETMSLDEDTKKNFAKRTGMKITDFALKKVGIRDKSKNPEIAKADIGHYVRYRTILDMYNEKKPKEEIFKAYRQLGGGDGYEKYLRGKKEEVVTPDEIIHYEKNHVSNEGRYHEYLLKQLNELDSNTSDKDAVDFYVKQARLSDVTLFEKLKSKIAAIGIDFDTEFQKEIKPEDYLTPEVIMQYEEAAYKSKAAKHQYRIDILSKEDVTDENVYATYTETLGGGKGFFKNSKNSELLEKEQNETVRYYMTYNEIMKYENKRKEAYKKTMDAANAPLKDLFDVRNELQAQMLKLDSYKKQIVEYTAKPVGDVFKDAGSIEKFEEETMGSDAVNVLAESEDALNDSDSVKLEALMDEIVKCQEELEALESDDEKDPTTANK